jgi:hypothetical protein
LSSFFEIMLNGCGMPTPRKSESEPEPEPAKPPAIVPRDIPTMGELLKALKGVCDGWTPTDDRERTNTAKKLRALANQIDPPAENLKSKSRRKRKPLTPPSLEEVNEYCQRRKSNVDSQDFIDHYASKHWKTQNNEHIKSWQKVFRDFEIKINKNSN